MRKAGAPSHVARELESWWDALACGIVRLSGGLALGEAERAARRIIEDLVFLRLWAEGAPSMRQPLVGLQVGPNVGDRFCELVRWAESQLGGGLFRVTKGSGENADDVPVAGLADETLRGMVAGVRTWVIPPGPGAAAETLGWTHQRLLGLRLHRTASDEVRSEKTADLRKRTGVFYTPQSVTSYMAERVLSPLLERPIPQPDAFPEVSVLDPACGCGAFLWAALRFLVRRHRRRGATPSFDRAAKALHGMDLDGDAVLAARRSLWLEMLAAAEEAGRGVSDAFVEQSPHLANVLAANVRPGDVLADGVPERLSARFDVVLGNPPYRRELGAKPWLDRIASTDLGRRFRSPRMDLWYYFLHRGLELLKPGGGLSFLVSSYWTAGRGAEKLIDAMREGGRIEELFLLGRSGLFAGASGRHMILVFRKEKAPGRTTIKRARPADPGEAAPSRRRLVAAEVFCKDSGQLFRGGRLDLEPPADAILARMARWPPLGRLGMVRQGIVENPAAINGRTNRQYGNRWQVGEGVFALRPEKVAWLGLPERERSLLRPYHDLCDLGRYYIAPQASLSLIYSTRETWSEADQYPALRDHLRRFRAVMCARRETRSGLRAWWQLHWPREEMLWRTGKIVALQMAPRPAFACAPDPLYVPFSANVFVAKDDTREDLRWLTALLNSRLMWKWFRHHAKRRGVALEINGNVLARAPVRTIDFADSADRARHDRLAELAEQMATIQRGLRKAPAAEQTALRQRQAAIDRRIDEAVYELYGLAEKEIAAVEAGEAASQ